MNVRSLATWTLLLCATPALAETQPFIDPAGAQSAVGQKAAGYWRQFTTFNSLPFGISLDAYYLPEKRSVIEGFFQQGQDFTSYSGLHPFQVLSGYGEHWDLGMFGGVALAADAFRYILLRDGRGEAGDVAAARARVLAALDAWHVETAATGGDGCVARGVMKKTPAAIGDPPVPGGIPVTTPTSPIDHNGDHWRDDRSGQNPDWIFMDNVSKDQLTGYMFGLGVLWDAIAADASIPDSYKDRMKADATAIAKRLMRKVQVADGVDPIDLVITDWDGAPVPFHDLNPREITPGLVLPDDTDVFNGFNAALGLAVVRIAYHVGGDPEVGRWYYEDLIGTRQVHKAMAGTLTLMYTGPSTNFSNVNMAATALYSLCRYESDPGLSAFYRDVLEKQFYNPGEERQAKGLKQSYFDFIYAGLKNGATDEAAVADGIETLLGFPDVPYFNDAVVNCDATEIAASHCVCIDGTTQVDLQGNVGHGNDLVASTPLPKRLRPPSNFEWRSDPYSVNDIEWKTLDPGGDFLAAYYMARLFQRTADNQVNLSPFRVAPPSGWTSDPAPEGVEDVADVPAEVTGTPDVPAAGDVVDDSTDTAGGGDVPAVADAGTDVGKASSGGGGCSAGGGRPVSLAGMLLVMALACGYLVRKRRRETA